MAKKLAILGAAVMAAAAVTVPVEAGAVDGSVVTETFEFTGDVQTFVVPEGVTEVDVVACGAQGGEAIGPFEPGPGGRGGRAAAQLGVTPGELLTVVVGGSGEGVPGGFNGGGDGSDLGSLGSGWLTPGGGGASDVRQGGDGFEHRVVIGGGGGGGHEPIFVAGAGGGLSGGDGLPLPRAGSGGSQVSGGEGGRWEFPGAAVLIGDDGVLGRGGNGSLAGAGGGGGLFGGGGGGNGPGGGGSGLGDSFETGLCEGDGWVTISFEEPSVVVDVDVKPGSDPNPINTKSKGVIPVAILTTNDFDATTVDPPTVLFSGAAPLRWAYEDVDSDGDTDVIFHYRTQETAIAVGDPEACVEGTTFEGVPIGGCDSVIVRR